MLKIFNIIKMNINKLNIRPGELWFGSVVGATEKGISQSSNSPLIKQSQFVLFGP